MIGYIFHFFKNSKLARFLIVFKKKIKVPKHTIKAHGDEINVETKAGEGAEFISQLPIV